MKVFIEGLGNIEACESTLREIQWAFTYASRFHVKEEIPTTARIFQEYSDEIYKQLEKSGYFNRKQAVS